MSGFGLSHRVVRTFSSINAFNYRKWTELSTGEKQDFVSAFVKTYKKNYPGSKTNVSLKGLALDMKKFNDAPSVFGIFYEDIRKINELKRESLYGSGSTLKSKDLIKDYGRFGHESFHELLIE